MKKTPDFCINCAKKSKKTFIACEKCHSGRYCSETCLEAHPNHEQYCAAICSLQEFESQKCLKKSFCVADSEKLPLKLKKKLVSLVGEKPLVSVKLNGESVYGLWDTGAQVTMINRKLAQEIFPGVKIQSVEEFLKNDQKLKILSANQSELNIDGVMIVDFGTENDDGLFQVPFLVTSDELSRPIYWL